MVQIGEKGKRTYSSAMKEKAEELLYSRDSYLKDT